ARARRHAQPPHCEAGCVRRKPSAVRQAGCPSNRPGFRDVRRGARGHGGPPGDRWPRRVHRYTRGGEEVRPPAGEDTSVAADDEQQEAAAPARPSSTPRALLWTAASVPLPGITHLRMGRRTGGALILLAYLGG